MLYPDFNNLCRSKAYEVELFTCSSRWEHRKTCTVLLFDLKIYLVLGLYMVLTVTNKQVQRGRCIKERFTTRWNPQAYWTFKTLQKIVADAMACDMLCPPINDLSLEGRPSSAPAKGRKHGMTLSGSILWHMLRNRCGWTKNKIHHSAALLY